MLHFHNPDLIISDLLTRQELIILRLASQGFSNKEIGNKLFIEENTVKRHRQNIMKKLGIKGKPAMMKFLLNYKKLHLIK